MESAEDVSPEDDQYQQIEEFAEDTHTSEVSAICEEVQLVSLEDRGNVYPVPWADVKTVGYLFSLVGTDSIVSISPREVATTINKDVLISHYENYLRRDRAKKDMVVTIQKIFTDTLELVEGRMKSIRSFVDALEPLVEGSTSKDYYEEHRNLPLECRVHLRQTGDDLSLLAGRLDQYVIERSGLLDELDRFLRTQVRLFPEYKDLNQ